MSDAGRPPHTGTANHSENRHENTVAVGSTDLHSVAQLRLDGADHAHTTFLTAQHPPTPALGQDEEFDALVADLQHKSFAQIMNAIQQGTLHAYEQAGRSHDTIALAGQDEASVGSRSANSSSSR